MITANIRVKTYFIKKKKSFDEVQRWGGKVSLSVSDDEQWGDNMLIDNKPIDNEPINNEPINNEPIDDFSRKC